MRRNRVADGAADHDFLLARVADDLLERLSAINRSFPTALNLGLITACSAGGCASKT